MEIEILKCDCKTTKKLRGEIIKEVELLYSLTAVSRVPFPRWFVRAVIQDGSWLFLISTDKLVSFSRCGQCRQSIWEIQKIQDHI